MHYMKIKWREFHMDIGRGHRRGHPKDTSKGVTWPSVTTGVAQLPVVLPHTQENPEFVKWASVTSGIHVTTVLLQRKKSAKSRACAEHTSGHVFFLWRQSDVTSDQNCTTALVRRKTKLEKTGHAQCILPVRAASGHVTMSLPVKRPH
jgi:hypothetical protein